MQTHEVCKDKFKKNLETKFFIGAKLEVQNISKAVKEAVSMKLKVRIR